MEAENVEVNVMRNKTHNFHCVFFYSPRYVLSFYGECELIESKPERHYAFEIGRGEDFFDRNKRAFSLTASSYESTKATGHFTADDARDLELVLGNSESQVIIPNLNLLKKGEKELIQFHNRISATILATSSNSGS
ncbi:hypothetical protein HY212_06085 [Candidatus Pacearchaeota archaeon]|nr:hypothetical protein [Candidatus Pacearchaeota archaeon]